MDVSAIMGGLMSVGNYLSQQVTAAEQDGSRKGVANVFGQREGPLAGNALHSRAYDSVSREIAARGASRHQASLTPEQTGVIPTFMADHKTFETGKMRPNPAFSTSALSDVAARAGVNGQSVSSSGKEIPKTAWTGFWGGMGGDEQGQGPADPGARGWATGLQPLGGMGGTVSGTQLAGSGASAATMFQQRGGGSVGTGVRGYEPFLGHSNMVPHYGSRIKQPMLDRGHAVGDRYLEANPRLSIKPIHKKEVGRLFSPVWGMTNIYGNREHRDLSRYHASVTGKKHGELPFDQVRVGPALAAGYGAQGQDGFHPRVRIMPKSGDQLYLNPKTEEEARINHPKAPTEERGVIGTVFQYKPPVLRDNSDGKWNLPTGNAAFTARTLRPMVVLPETARAETTAEYFGGPGPSVQTGAKARPMVKVSRRQNFWNTPFRNLGFNMGHTTEGYAQHGGVRMNSPNNRRTTGDFLHWLNLFGGWFSSYTPYTDKAKVTRKQHYIDHARPWGNLGNPYMKGPAYDPKKWRPKTTLKETVEETAHGGAGFVTGAARKGVAYDPKKWRAKTTVKETTEDAPHGGLGFVGTNRLDKGAYSVTGVRARNTNRLFTGSTDYKTPAGPATTRKTMSQDSAYNARLNDKRSVNGARRPMGGGPSLARDATMVKMESKKLDSDRESTRALMQTDQSTGTTFNPYVNLTSQRNNLWEHDFRLDPAIMTAYHSNPLARRIGSFA